MFNIYKTAPRLIGLLIAGVMFSGLCGTASASVRFEHIAINVESPKQVADWYVENLGLMIISESKAMIFVGDTGHNFMFELYSKPEAKGNYSDLNHDSSHVAFAADDAEAVAKKMVAAGAKILKQFTSPAGDTVINMADPWGNNLQVIKRVKPKL